MFLKVTDLIKPGNTALFLARFFCWVLKTVGPRKEVAKKNIELVFPGISDDKRDEILAKSYENMVWTGIEFLALHGNPSAAGSWFVENKGVEHIDKALLEKRGVILLTAHIGNWELAAWAIASRYGGVAAIARSSDSMFQRELIAELRDASGIKIIDKKEPMTRALGIIKKNGILGLLSDQHGGSEGIDVPFFGVETKTVTGIAVFAYLTGAAILPVNVTRVAPFKLKLEIEEPLKWEKKASRDDTIYDITKKTNEVLERMVRRYPEQWLWQHRRFRELEK